MIKSYMNGVYYFEKYPILKKKKNESSKYYLKRIKKYNNYIKNQWLKKHKNFKEFERRTKNAIVKLNKIYVFKDLDSNTNKYIQNLDKKYVKYISGPLTLNQGFRNQGNLVVEEFYNPHLMGCNYLYAEPKQNRYNVIEYYE